MSRRNSHTAQSFREKIGRIYLCSCILAVLAMDRSALLRQRLGQTDPVITELFVEFSLAFCLLPTAFVACANVPRCRTEWTE